MRALDAIASVFRNYAKFSGRARRAEFWWFTLLTFLLQFAPIFGVIWNIVAFVPGLAVTSRRLHNTGNSAWWMALPLAAPVVLWLSVIFQSEAIMHFSVVVAIVSAIGFLAILIMVAGEGDTGPNRFGDDPLDPTVNAQVPA